MKQVSKIESTLKNLKQENKVAIIPYVTAGFPNKTTNFEIIKTIIENGASILELGIPYSDPLADGEVIQRTSKKALDEGFRIRDVFSLCNEIRKISRIPLVIMVYYNSVFNYGIQKFIKDAKKSDVNGLIIPDLPLEEREEMSGYLKEVEIDFIPLVAPTSKDRIKKLVKNSSGFVYCVSSTGVTGQRKLDIDNINEFLTKVRVNTSIPICVGFGISTKEDVEALKGHSDGIIIGSAILKIAEKAIEKNDMTIISDYLLKLTKNL